VRAGSEEIAKPRFESRPGVEYKLWEDGIQTRQPVAQELDMIHILHGCKFCRLISGVGVLDQICCLVSIERVLVYISKHVNIKRVILMAVTMTSCSTALLAAKSILLISHL